jgi:hypothetical protein
MAKHDLSATLSGVIALAIDSDCRATTSRTSCGERIGPFSAHR